MDPAHIDRLGATNQHPVDILEPLPPSETHEIMVRSIQILGGFATWVLAADKPRVGAWQAVYALGLPQATKSMADVAEEEGVERATISAGARNFCKTFDLPPSPAMRSEEAVEKYRDSRNNFLK